ncbi:MAG: DNA methyltransferase [Dethiobacteria bacterium]
MIDIEKLFLEPLKSTRAGSFYNSFPYPTKISPEAIAIYIACMTSPGDLVLDTFGGSGSTGVAALLCEHPTEEMKRLSSEMNVSLVWGKRYAVIYELGTYASFASRTITSKISAKEFQKALDKFILMAEKEVTPYYRTHDENGEDGLIRYVIWSEILLCPECKREFNYFSEGTTRNPVSFKKDIVCPFCGKMHNVDEMEYATETAYDSLLKANVKRKKRVPAWIYGITGKRRWDRPADEIDLAQYKDIESRPYDKDDTPKKIKWGDLHRSGYHFGITYLHQMYTKRNYTVFYKLWKLADCFEKKQSDALKLLLLSYNSAHCTMMTRVVAKHNAKDLCSPVYKAVFYT